MAVVEEGEMRKLVIIVTALMGLVALVAVSVAVAQEDTGVSPVQTDRVETRGKNDFKANSIIFSTLAFAPGDIQVTEGQRVRFIYGGADESNEPHTVTIVDQADLPTTFNEIFTCQVCGQALEAHFEGLPSPPEDMEIEIPEPTQPIVDVGQEGLDAPGDSLFFDTGERAVATVSAPAGTTFYYLCAIHPWMQGSIHVTEQAGTAP